MAVETLSPTSQPRALLDRPLALSQAGWEVAAYFVIVALSVIAHLWGLGTMAMHHDESIHAWSSWRFYTGAGAFSCWGGGISPTYCYDPVYHGPSLYVLTLIAYFLFGDGDAQARLPMALAGIGMVASAWWLRPYFGRRGALVAALLLGFSPALLYYTRFARHDGLMVLWEIWMFIGVFRWLDSGRPGWLYLVAASLALAIATHELYYILFFIFGIFVLMRLIAESRFAARLNLGLLIILGICVFFMIVNPPLPIGVGLYIGEKAFLVASALLLAWLCQRLWDPQPLLTERLKQLWFNERRTLWIAVAILVSIYTVLYTTFFAYPRGFIDGLYAGLAYWLGTQQDYARGDQPWYYYLMLLPLYEPLAVTAGIGMVVTMITLVVQRWLSARATSREVAGNSTDQAAESVPLDEPQVEHADGATPLEADDEQGKTATLRSLEDSAIAEAPGSFTTLRLTPASVAAHAPGANQMQLVPLLLVFWLFTATIIFSWAGEKMPWLLVHMALPGNLLAAWVIGRLLRLASGQNPENGAPDPFAATDRRRIWAVPPLFAFALIGLGVAAWRLSGGGEGREAQANVLQSLVPLLLAGVLIYVLLTIASQIGWRPALAAMGLTLTIAMGGYMLRSTWLVVYDHPDVAIEPMIYTQTSPDVPRYVNDIRELAVNLTRNRRTSEDVAGGLTMPVILDAGSREDTEGSLAWPLQWYLRDFKRIVWKNSDDLRDGDPATTLEVQLPDGSTGLAPVVMLSKASITAELREFLEANYAQPYGEGGVFNWWFPEGDKCSPRDPGYKRFYYSSWTPRDQLTASSQGAGHGGNCGRDISQEVYGPFTPLIWPFLPDHWGWMRSYLLYRELPYPLVSGARMMEVWLRSDLAGSVGEAAVPEGAGTSLRLVAQQSFGQPGDLSSPTGAVVDGQGRLYVADTGNHRVQVYNADGTLLRTIGGFGSGEGQFYEPRGLAVDAQGNLYVADTWNARIVKFDPGGQLLKSWGSGAQDLGDGRQATISDGSMTGNAALTTEFFGPRGIAVDGQGNIYVADTGNKRIVVTDSEGNYRYQWGFAGSEVGSFNEPTGIAVDGQGNVYVADTWNGRVQVFGPQAGGQVSPVPFITWRVSGWRPNTYDDPSIAVSPSSQVYMSVPARNMVMAANLRGEIVLRWGGTGSDLASLNAPSGMAVGPDNSVYVVDRTGNRVLRFVLPQVGTP